jgi:hypothetical protein
MEGQHIQENVPMSVPLEHEGAGGTYRLLYGPNFNCLKYSSRIVMYFKYIRELHEDIIALVYFRSSKSSNYCIFAMYIPSIYRLWEP